MRQPVTSGLATTLQRLKEVLTQVPAKMTWYARRQAIRMTKSSLSLVAVQISVFLLARTHAQSTELQSRATQKPQTITIKLVDGRNGQPVSRSHVNVWVGTARRDAIVIPTDGNGVASVQLTTNPAGTNIPASGNGSGSVVVVNPVVTYDDSLLINAGYVLCQPNAGDYSWLKTMTFATSRVLQEGVAMPNTCGRTTAVAKPGEVVIFVRPLNWKEKFKQ